MSFSTRSSTQNIISSSKSSSSSSSNFNRNKKKTNKISRKDLILDDTIVKMYLGFEKIGLPIHGFTDIAFFIPRIFLPSITPIISGKTFYHASLLLQTEKNYYIVLEYGAYRDDIIDKEKHTYKTYYWFEQKYGLRYAEMDYNIYIDKKLDLDSYSERIFPLECKRKSTLRQLLIECNEKKKWNYENYDFACQNCQHFVTLFIKQILGYRRKKTAYRGLHNLSSALIPRNILNQIEENEDEIWNTVGKIPILGPLIGYFYMICNI